MKMYMFEKFFMLYFIFNNVQEIEERIINALEF